MKAGQALDLHGLLLEVLEASLIARDLINIIGRRQGAVQGDGGAVVVNHLRAGETFHVADTVTHLVGNRESKLQGTSQFGWYVPPSPCGCIVLDEPIRLEEAEGVASITHMITWGPARLETANEVFEHGTLIVMWNDNRREPDELIQVSLGEKAEWGRLLDETAGLLPISILAVTPDARIGPSFVPTPWGRREELESFGLKSRASCRSPLRLLCAMWQLMDETITVLEDAEKFGSKHRRRAERRGHKPRVTVVTLRRTSYRGAEGARGPLTERHRVRGHYRKYWVGSGADRHQERRYVRPHESPKDPRLPEAAPTTKVYDLRR
jgi:hypothetical protein